MNKLKVGLAAVAATGALAATGVLAAGTGDTKTTTHQRPAHAAAAGFDQSSGAPTSDSTPDPSPSPTTGPPGSGAPCAEPEKLPSCTKVANYASGLLCNITRRKLAAEHPEWDVRCAENDDPATSPSRPFSLFVSADSPPDPSLGVPPA